MILATACCQLVQQLFVQQAAAQLRNSLFRKSHFPLSELPNQSRGLRCATCVMKLADSLVYESSEL